MTEQEFLASDDPRAMLAYLDRRKPETASVPIIGISDRKLRLFACACCRSCWSLLADERSRDAVEVAERFADGLATAYELHRVSSQANDVPGTLGTIAWAASRPDEFLSGDVTHTLDWLKQRHDSPPSDVLAALLREVAGNPFSAPPALPRTAATLSLARQIYAERDFALMGLLRDALMDGGCSDEAALSHCLESSHVRGCWLIDLVLEKS